MEKTLNLRRRINIVIEGDPARWLTEWERRGFISSTRDAVVQAFQLLQERFVDLQLKNKSIEG